MKIERASISTKSRNINFYLQEIENLDWVEFDCLRPYSTYGDWRPPYPYQWMATTRVRPGDDDPFEGVGGTPLEAVKDLYKSLMAAKEFEAKGDKE